MSLENMINQINTIGVICHVISVKVYHTRYDTCVNGCILSVLHLIDFITNTSNLYALLILFENKSH